MILPSTLFGWCSSGVEILTLKQNLYTKFVYKMQYDIILILKAKIVELVTSK